MISLSLGLVIICVLCWVGYHITGAFLEAILWVFIKLPMAILL